MSILKATVFATKAHGKQTRKSTELPYIIHPLRVALILQNKCNVYDEDVLVAAILHDVLEDTPIKAKEIANEFGERIASLVREVTDDKTLSVVERKRAQIDHAPIITPGALLIKIADKIDNVSGFVDEGIPEGWSESRVRGYAAWSLAVARAGIFQRESDQDYRHDLHLAFYELEKAVAPHIGKDAVEHQKLLETYFQEFSVS